MTKHEEKYLFNMFQESYKAMPLGTAYFDDKPDVIFTTSTRSTIGIELTECIYDENLMKISEYKIKFNEKVIENLKDKMPFKFHLNIKLDIKNPIRQNMITSTIERIVEVCVNEFEGLEQYESKVIEQLDVDWNKAPLHIQQHFHSQGYRKLPKGISSIKMRRYDILEISRHPEFKGGFIPDFTDDNLSSVLNKKNKALVNYKACDQQWLVIGEGADFYSSVDKVRIEKDIETEFGKIFMYKRWESDVIIIK